jgi:hypothetical protein
MKKFLIVALLGIPRTISSSEPVVDTDVYTAVNMFNPYLSLSATRDIIESLAELDLAVDKIAFLGLIAQESGFHIDPQNCALAISKCQDFGLTQINYATWRKKFNLDKMRLLKSIHYNLYVANEILHYLKKKHYETEGDDFITRYFSATDNLRDQYRSLIKKKTRKIRNARINHTARL